MLDKEKVTYTVTWSEYEAVYVGSCLEFPDVKRCLPTPEEALNAIREGVANTIANFERDGEQYLQQLEDFRILVHPAVILREDCLERYGLSAQDLADRIQIPVAEVTEVIQERAPVTAAWALRLWKLFGISVQYWLNLQNYYDVQTALRDDAEILDGILHYLLEDFDDDELAEMGIVRK